MTNLITPHALFSPTYLLNLVKPELAPFDPTTPKTHPKTKHEVDRTTLRGDMAIWNFPKCEVVGRWSLVGPQYFFLHWSHILLTNVAKRSKIRPKQSESAHLRQVAILNLLKVILMISQNAKMTFSIAQYLSDCQISRGRLEDFYYGGFDLDFDLDLSKLKS